MKKHSSYFSKKEMNYVINRFKGVKHCDWRWTDYAQARLIEREVDHQVLNTIWSDGFTVIEYHFHEKKKHNRVLIRSVCTDENDNQVCVVFNFTTMEIHTVYLNQRSNKHNDADFLEDNNRDLDVITMMKTKHQGAYSYR